MLLAWDLKNIENNLYNIVCLSVFALMVIILVISLILVHIHKKIQQSIAKSLDLIEALKQSPLKHRIQRVAIVAEVSNILVNETNVWRTKYEILFEKELIKAMVKLGEMCQDKKTTSPNLKNLRAYNEIYTKLIDINNNVHQILIEITSSLEMELIQRDTLTYQKEIFSNLKDEATMLTFQEDKIDNKQLEKLISRVEDIFSDFFDYLDDGDFRSSWERLDAINQSIQFFAFVLDSIPYVSAAIETVIPEKLLEIKNKYVTFGNNEKHLSRNGQKYYELETEIDTLRVNIRNFMKKTQIIKARAALENAFMIISEYKDYFEHDDNLKKFFDENTEIIRDYIDEINTACVAVDRAFNSLYSVKMAPPKEKLEFEDARTSFNRTKIATDKIFANVDVYNAKSSDYSTLKEQLSVVLKDVLKDVSRIEKAARSIEKENTNIESLLNQIIFVQSTLTQCNVKINQFRSVTELKDLTKDLNLINDEVSMISKENLLAIQSLEEKKYISDQVSELQNRALELSLQVNDKIFLDFISQELIAYLERYSAQNPEIDRIILQCEELFKARQLNPLITVALNTLGSIKRVRN